MESPIHSALHPEASISQDYQKVFEITKILLNANKSYFINSEKLDLQSKNSKGKLYITHEKI